MQPDLQAEPVDAGTLCLGCRYDLGGLDKEARCPECALPVQETIGWRWLGTEPAAYRSRLASASTVVWSASLAMTLAILVLGVVSLILLIDSELFRLAGSPVAWCILTLITAELAIGWWFLTAPSPRTARGRDGLHAFRMLPRLFGISATVLAGAGISIAMLVTTPANSGSGPVLLWLSGPGGVGLLSIAMLASLLGALLCQLTGVWYLSRFATRLSPKNHRYEPGTLALALRQTGWMPVYAIALGLLAVALYPVAILMVGLFAIVPISWAVLTAILVPGALLLALIRSVWLVASFGRAVRTMKLPLEIPVPALHSVSSEGP